MTMRGEDKPLLVSILDPGRGSKGSDDEAYSDTKYGQSGMLKRWKYGMKSGNGRAKNMIMGAASIFNKWPDHLTMIWLIAVAFCMIVITFILVMESSKNSVPQSFSALSIQKKCLARHDAIIKSTHQKYPDKTNIYLHVILNGKEKFSTKKFKDLFMSVVQRHPNHFMNVYVLYNDTLDMEYKRNARFKDWELHQKTFDAPRFFETSSADDEHNAIIPFHAQRDTTGIIDFENINIVRSSLSSYFLHSPLRFRWRLFPDSMIPFVLRVLSLWEHGGITMPWQLFKEKTDIYCVKKDVVGQLKDLVGGLNRKNIFDNIPTTRMSKQQLIEEIQTFVDIGPDLTVESKSKLMKMAEEPMRHFNINDTQLEVPILSNPNRKRLPKKIKNIVGKIETKREMAKLLQGAKPGDYHSSSKGIIEKIGNNDNESPSSSSSSSSSSSLNYIKKLKQKLLENEHESKDLSSTEKKIRKMLKNPQILKKLQKVDVNNMMDKENRLKRIKRDLQIAQLKTLPPPNSNAVKLKTNLTNKMKSVRYLPLIRSRSSLSSSRSMDNSSDFDSSDYYDSYSSSYSGYVAPKPYRPNLRRSKIPIQNRLNWPPSSDSMFKRKTKRSKENISSSSNSIMNTLGGIASSASSDSSFSKSQDYFKEKKSYVSHKVFETVNVFSMPNKLNLVADRFGYYFSTKKPCHAFLGELISVLQSSDEVKTPEMVMEKGLKVFCRGHKFNDCVGITLL